jgi:hypothetical protein
MPNTTDVNLGQIVSADIHALPPNPCFGQIVSDEIHNLPPQEAGGFSHGQLVASTIHELPPNPCFGQIVSQEVLGDVHNSISDGFLLI